MWILSHALSKGFLAMAVRLIITNQVIVHIAYSPQPLQAFLRRAGDKVNNTPFRSKSLIVLKTKIIRYDNKKTEFGGHYSNRVSAYMLVCLVCDLCVLHDCLSDTASTCMYVNKQMQQLYTLLRAIGNQTLTISSGSND